MGFVLFHFTLIVLLASVLSSAACLSAYLVSRKRVLLFAFHKLDAFPKDVWVKRLMAQFYPGGLPECTLGIEGIAQQYLFDYVRNGGGLLVTND